MDRKTFIRLFAEIGKQGSNLNQIAKAMNVWIKTGNDPKIYAGMIQPSDGNKPPYKRIIGDYQIW